MAQIAATGQENVSDTVQIALTVPRGLRPTGMTIQGEDQTLLDVIFSLLLELLTQLDPDLSGLVNDLLGIDVGEEQITFVYDYDRDLVIGQPFPITLEVVGEVVGEFTVTGQAFIESSTSEPLALMSAPMSSANATLDSVSFQVIDPPTQPTPPSQNCTPSSSPRCSIATELEAYGVWVVDLNEPETVGAGYWTDSELNELLTGVQRTAQAFVQFSSQTYGSDQDAFKAILLYNPTERIEFSQTNNLPIEQDSTCNTTARTPADIAAGAARATIVWGGHIIFTQYSAVHELGHIFLNQTNHDTPVNVTAPAPCVAFSGGKPFIDCVKNPVEGSAGLGFGRLENSFIFGPRTRRFEREEVRIIINREIPSTPDINEEMYEYHDYDPVTNPSGDDATPLDDWERGTRGWGSDAPNPGACGASAGQVPTDFQQNPCVIVDWIARDSAVAYGGEPFADLQLVEQEETGADMFLNWVYRTLSLGGFQNVDWDIAQSDNEGFTPSSTGPGDDRQYWMNERMAEHFVYFGW